MKTNPCSQPAAYSHSFNDIRRFFFTKVSGPILHTAVFLHSYKNKGEFWVDRRLCDAISILNGIKQNGTLSIQIFNVFDQPHVITKGKKKIRND
jgi:hypothetical protein